MTDLTPLICPQCGGKIEITTKKFEDVFVENSKGSFIFIGDSGEKIQCANCGTGFERKSTFKKFLNVSVKMGDRSSAIILNGNVQGSNILIGNGNKIG